MLLNNYHGRQFNSLNDVAVNPRNNHIYFTDVTYGERQDFRPKPRLPNQVYRFNMETKAVTVVADSFDMCNGTLGQKRASNKMLTFFLRHHILSGRKVCLHRGYRCQSSLLWLSRSHAARYYVSLSCKSPCLFTNTDEPKLPIRRGKGRDMGK